MPSNDLFTVSALSQVMASVDPDHPVVRSFSVAYWPGDDEAVESVLFRPRFFDKLVAWGCEAAIRGPALLLASVVPPVETRSVRGFHDPSP